ncbi:solute carrier family 40 member 1-like [Macrobrachium nipponense]|uniref:solute carrier family 40 member 1-like n=1 Tax=Macrobrachium nipponense TaxID=159736 RepID=UPI0030C853C6
MTNSQNGETEDKNQGERQATVSTGEHRESLGSSNSVQNVEGNEESSSKRPDGITLLQEDQDGVPEASSPDSKSKERSAIDEVNPSRCAGCLRVVKTARFQVYLSHFLSSWGDRMWMFAGGLFLLEVTPGSLRLAATYGAALALTVIIFGAPVGRLVDRTCRLKMAQVSLCIQNLMVCVCAAILVVVTTRREWFKAWDGWALIVAEGFVILTACIAQIGTLGSKLTIEKDWILVICGQDQTLLAGMNSVLRSLDLSTEVLAPVIVGTIMSNVGNAAGGIVIASWNVGSLIVEYGLLHHLYHSSDDLQKPKLISDIGKEMEGDDCEVVDPVRSSKWDALKNRFVSAWGAWLAYMRHPVRNAGLGLSLLYMTVLAFDNYSRGFVFESGVSETVLGILTAVASLFGIFGALMYPVLRTKFGLPTTGLIGFGSETFCLVLCVASVFAPGSPFDASALIYSKSTDNQSESPVTANPVITYDTASLPSSVNDSIIVYYQNVTEKSVFEGVDESGGEAETDFTFVILLLTGIITSRTGLWIADLSVTQLLQENVEEQQRGAINGVQSSLNQTLDLLRSILLIILPTRATFGFLIILSFVFVTIGWALFGVYARKERVKLSSVNKEVEAVAV